uniref:Uncharacterized protein n=1 Tax=Lates calcarifer TaxID=8187 RepID=A0A4W6FF31_LATCA
LCYEKLRKDGEITANVFIPRNTREEKDRVAKGNHGKCSFNVEEFNIQTQMIDCVLELLCLHHMSCQ